VVRLCHRPIYRHLMIRSGHYRRVSSPKLRWTFRALMETQFLRVFGVGTSHSGSSSRLCHKLSKLKEMWPADNHSQSFLVSVIF